MKATKKLAYLGVISKLPPQIFRLGDVFAFPMVVHQETNLIFDDIFDLHKSAQVWKLRDAPYLYDPHPFRAPFVEWLDQNSSFPEVGEGVEDAFGVGRCSSHNLVQNQAWNKGFSPSAIGISHGSAAL